MNIHYTFKEYEQAYQSLLDKFINEYEDNSELDFLAIQLENYNTYVQHVTLLEYGGDVKLPEYILRGYSMIKELEDKIYKQDEISPRMYDYEMIDKLYRSFKKIIQFINSKKEKIKNEDLTIPTKEISEEIDLSDSSGIEKIIMLYKLGILDFLKTKSPFKSSTNSLASVISGITGVNTTTVQSYINPINNPNVIQKNNPLDSSKAVEKVEVKLLNIGFNPAK
ncbi:hypothetical protein [Flavobacterium soli]|uniref:hypothetical protein n=1 Tax=Flavobacterium soli TaxID=344881 RepID=UPI0012F8DA0B|nr:hypothetical protein [Flavobacterium soli]